MKKKLIETLQYEEDSLLSKIKDARLKDDFNKYKMLIQNLINVVHLKDEQMQRYKIKDTNTENLHKKLSCGDIIKFNEYSYKVHKITSNNDYSKITIDCEDLYVDILKNLMVSYDFFSQNLIKSIDFILTDLGFSYNEDSLNNIINHSKNYFVSGSYNCQSAYYIIMDIFKQCNAEVVLRTKKDDNGNYILHFEEK